MLRKVAALIASTVACAFLAAGCGSSSSPTASSVHRSTPCAWPTRADKATQNLAYPDTASTYWTTSYRLAPGERLELHGRFPHARYASFVSYGIAGGVVSALTDRDIRPDPGGGNPFASSGATSGTYAISIQASGTGANVLRAARSSAGAATTTTTTIPGLTGPTPLGSGTSGGAGVVTGTVIYRVYLSAQSGDPTGGVGLPAVREVSANGASTSVMTCAHATANPAARAIVNASGPATNTPAPAQPTFIRPKSSQINLFPDPDNVYLATILHYRSGEIAVVRGKAPTFPDTARGVSASTREQVRYWSLCTDEYRKPYPVSFCVADQDVALDAQGFYTIVVSTPADRPANADAAHHVTWLDWGSTAIDNLLLMRQMLAAPDFAGAAARLTPGALATSTMGPYAPTGSYCATATFAAGGPAACAP